MLAKLSTRKKWQGLVPGDRIGRNHRTRRANTTVDVDATGIVICEHGTGRDGEQGW